MRLWQLVHVHLPHATVDTMAEAVSLKLLQRTLVPHTLQVRLSRQHPRALKPPQDAQFLLQHHDDGRVVGPHPAVSDTAIRVGPP